MYLLNSILLKNKVFCISPIPLSIQNASHFKLFYFLRVYIFYFVEHRVVVVMDVWMLCGIGSFSYRRHFVDMSIQSILFHYNSLLSSLYYILLYHSIKLISYILDYYYHYLYLLFIIIYIFVY